MKIETIKTNKKLKEVYDFLSKVFYEEAKEYNERYYNMCERFTEISEQFEKDNELLLYIEDKGKIIAGLTSKGMNKEKQKITIGIIGIAKEYRRKGYAKVLITEFEKRCQDKEIFYIELGSRIRACPLYISMGYKASLMVQVFDFETIDSIRKANNYNLQEISSWQGNTYGFVFFWHSQSR